MSGNLAQKNDSKSKTATVNAWESIIFHDPDAGLGLTPDGQRLYQLIHALVKMGYASSWVPVGIVQKTVQRRYRRASSRSAIYRGLAELDRRGLLHRSAVRRGFYRFNVGAFANNTIRAQKPTQAHKSQNWDQHDLLNNYNYLDNNRVNIKHVTRVTIKQTIPDRSIHVGHSDSFGPNQKTRQRDRGKSDPVTDRHPILYTLVCCLVAMGLRFTSGRGGRLMQLAELELNNEHQRTSGFAWRRWLRRDEADTGQICWQSQLDIAGRDRICREELIPALERRPKFLAAVSPPPCTPCGVGSLGDIVGRLTPPQPPDRKSPAEPLSASRSDGPAAAPLSLSDLYRKMDDVCADQAKSKYSGDT